MFSSGQNIEIIVIGNLKMKCVKLVARFNGPVPVIDNF